MDEMEHDTPPEAAAYPGRRADKAPKPGRPPIKVELRQLVGTLVKKGVRRRKAWDVDTVVLNGVGVADTNHRPGSAVCIMVGVQLTTREEEAIAAAIKEKRGQPPSGFIYPAPKPAGKLLEDDESGETSEYTYE